MPRWVDPGQTDDLVGKEGKRLPPPKHGIPEGYRISEKKYRPRKRRGPYDPRDPKVPRPDVKGAVKQGALVHGWKRDRRCYHPMMPYLMECPCCAGDPELRTGTLGGWYVLCLKCGLRTGLFPTSGECCRRWHQRRQMYLLYRGVRVPARNAQLAQKRQASRRKKWERQIRRLERSQQESSAPSPKPPRKSGRRRSRAASSAPTATDENSTPSPTPTASPPGGNSNFWG